MTLDELITDLKAAGANENTIKLAMNCYELGRSDQREISDEEELDNIWQAIKIEREACANVCDEADKDSQSQWPKRLATMIRARGPQ